MKKLIALITASFMTLGMTNTAFAKVIYHNLSTDGDLKIEETTGDTYEVTGSGETSNCIIVSDGVKTYIILNGVNISTTDESGIDAKNATVVLELKGENKISTDSNTKSGINVANGELTIKGNGKLEISTAGDGAGIGSDDGEAFEGKMTIKSGDVTAFSGDDGAGIGSGDDGDMSGSIVISGGTVHASSGDDGAGIGSGDDGDMSGSIVISGGTVLASSGDDGAGIGSGYDGNMSGSIVISGGTVLALNNDDYGAGIGSGDDGDISGSITIGGNAKVTAVGGTDGGAGIGSGDYGDMTDGSSIIIKDNAVVKATSQNDNPAIGLGDNHGHNEYVFNGSIQILDNANVTVTTDGSNAAIGSCNEESSGTLAISTGSTINGISGSDLDKLKEMGILDGIAEVTSVRPKNSNPSFSLERLNIVKRLKAAKSGDVVAVSEKQLNKGKLPAYVLETLAAADDVTLLISCEEFDILIKSDEAIADAGSTQFYTIDQLVRMYE